MCSLLGPSHLTAGLLYHSTAGKSAGCANAQARKLVDEAVRMAAATKLQLQDALTRGTSSASQLAAAELQLSQAQEHLRYSPACCLPPGSATQSWLL